MLFSFLGNPSFNKRSLFWASYWHKIRTEAGHSFPSFKMKLLVIILFLGAISSVLLGHREKCPQLPRLRSLSSSQGPSLPPWGGSVTWEKLGGCDSAWDLERGHLPWGLLHPVWLSLHSMPFHRHRGSRLHRKLHTRWSSLSLLCCLKRGQYVVLFLCLRDTERPAVTRH